MTASVPSKDTGTAITGISEARQSPKNPQVTRTTNRTEMANVRSTSRSEARMVGVRSIMMSKLAAEGNDALNCGSTARIRAMVSMMLAFG